MLHCSVVKNEILNYLRREQKQLPGKLGELEENARKDGVPIIPHETVVFLRFLLGQLKPKNVLEIGAATGFSSSLIASSIGNDGKITTIERSESMATEAKKNYEYLGLQDQVVLLKGEAAEILRTLSTSSFDFTFMDSAKSKYIVFLPEVLRVMKKGSVLMVDDIFQEGTVFLDYDEIPRGKRAIHKGLNKFLKIVVPHPDLTSTLLPLGDGIILITKEKEEIKL